MDTQRGRNLSPSKTCSTSPATTRHLLAPALLQPEACTTFFRRLSSQGVLGATERPASTSGPAKTTWSNTVSTCTTALDARTWSACHLAELNDLDLANFSNPRERTNYAATHQSSQTTPTGYEDTAAYCHCQATTHYHHVRPVSAYAKTHAPGWNDMK